MKTYLQNKNQRRLFLCPALFQAGSSSSYSFNDDESENMLANVINKNFNDFQRTLNKKYFLSPTLSNNKSSKVVKRILGKRNLGMLDFSNLNYGLQRAVYQNFKLRGSCYAQAN